HCYQARSLAGPAGDAGAHVGVDDTDRTQRRADLEAHRLPRIDRVNEAGHQRELAAAQGHERVAPAVDAVALDVRHRADARQVEVAADQRDRQWPTRLQGNILRRFEDLGTG